MQPMIRWMALVLAIATLQLSACTPAPAKVEKISPVEVEPIEGSKLKRVLLTEKAVERLDIQTVPVREEQVVRKRTVGGEVVALPKADAAGPSPVWVRVNFNKSDLSQVDRGQRVLIKLMDDEGEADDEDEQGDLEAEEGEPPEGVESELDDDDSDEGTLYYAVASAGQSFIPGQRVWVEMPLSGGRSSQKIIPYAAVIYDVHGETWVYTNPEPLVFIRQNIDVDYIEGDLAFLADGPPAGTKVATVGGAELYGAEIGVSK